MTMRPARQPMLTRAYVGKTVGGDDADAYAAPFLTVRDLLLGCFRRNVPLGTRLVLAADFAHPRARVAARRHARVRRGAPPLRRADAARRDRRDRIDGAVASLDADLEALDAPGDATASLIATWLAERKRLPHSARFAALLDGAFASIGREALGRAVSASEGLDAAPIWRVYARRRDALQARVGRRSDLVFGNYCQHFLLRAPYTDAATLLEYLTKLGMHLAAVRFLTVTHPDLAGRLAAAPDAAADAETFDRVAVHAIQSFTKAIGHHPRVHGDAAPSRRAAGSFSFGRLVMLAKFV